MRRRSEQPPSSGIVYIVDDERSVRDCLARVVEASGWTARPCGSGAELLRRLDGARPACVLLELTMPAGSGIEMQRELIAREIDLPIIFLANLEPLADAVEAFRAGAFDFLQKPVTNKLLGERVAAALIADARRVEPALARLRLESLTPRELKLCAMLAKGLGTKQIARELSLSERTIEHRRERVLKKTGTANAAELVSLYTKARSSPSNRP